MKKLFLFLAILASISVFGAEPSCKIVKGTFSGKYIQLIDCEGRKYKISIPKSDSVKFVTPTGWYLISSSGVLLEYKYNKK